MADITLTPTSYIVLGLLDVAGEATPYDLKRIASATVGGFWSVPHSQIYAEPARLSRAGLLEEQREETGRRRKTYRLTDAGREALASWLASADTDGFELRDPGLLKLAFGADPAQLARTQFEVHRQRAKELEAIASTLDVSGANEGPRLVAQCGVGLEREYARFWKRVAERA
jgi:PadR family transcriptional regulator AphA